MSNCKRAVDENQPPDDNHPDVPEEWPDVADEDVWEWQESDPKAPFVPRFEMQKQTEHELYQIPLRPNLDMDAVDKRLRRTVQQVVRLRSHAGKTSAIVHQGEREGIIETAEFCLDFIEKAEMRLVEHGNVFGDLQDTEELAELQRYRSEVNSLLTRLKLDAGVYTWRRAAYYRSIFFFKKYGLSALISLAVLTGGGAATWSVGRLIFLPPSSTDTSLTQNDGPQSTSPEEKATYVAARAGQDLIAENGQRYVVYPEGTLLARKGSSGIARLGSTVIVTEGAQAEVYGIAWAYYGSKVVLYPGGKVYADPGAQIDNRGGSVVRFHSADWPDRYRRL